MTSHFSSKFSSFSGERFFDAPSSFQSVANKLLTNPCFIRPFSRGHRYTVEGEGSTSASVISLLLLGFPSAILKTIVAIIINSTEGVKFRRLISHVVNKGLKIMPRFSNNNSTPTVAGIFFAVWVVAPLMHTVKGVIFWRSMPSMNSASTAGLFYFKASTRFSDSRMKVSGIHLGECPTRTRAEPSSLFRVQSRRERNNSEPSESLTGAVDKVVSSHNILHKILSTMNARKVTWKSLFGRTTLSAGTL